MISLPNKKILIELKDNNNVTQYSFQKQQTKNNNQYTGKCQKTNKKVKIKLIPKKYEISFQNQLNIQIQKIQKISSIENSQEMFIDYIDEFKSEQAYIYLIMQNWWYDLSEMMIQKQQKYHEQKQTDFKYFPDNDCIHITQVIYHALEIMELNRIQFKGLTKYDILFASELYKVAIDIGLQHFLRSKNNLNPDQDQDMTRGSLTQRIPYMSPQTKINSENKNSELFSQKCNVWAFGCILLQLMINELPWSQKNQKINSLNKFKERVLPKHFPADNNYQLKLKPEDLIKFNARPQKLQQLVKRCLIYNDNERLQLNQLEPLINELNNI